MSSHRAAHESIEATFPFGAFKLAKLGSFTGYNPQPNLYEIQRMRCRGKITVP